MATLFPDPEATDRVLVNLADEAQKHAREQLRAAKAILGAGIWPIAFANAALALEEMGKSILCLSVLTWPDAKRQEAAEGFKAAVNDHEFKAFCVYFVLGIVGEEPPEGLEQLFKKARTNARQTNRRKFRALYADSNATGHVLSPQDVTEEQAGEMVRIVEKVVGLSQDAADALADPDAYLAFLRQMRVMDPSGSMWDATEDDVAGVISAMRAIVLGEVDVGEALRGTPLETLVEQLRGPQVAIRDEANPAALAPAPGAAEPCPPPN
ncbi:AbiV family abortive infection protein [Streptomyces sp. NPDC001927]